MVKYICEVKKDNDNNELELVHTDKYDSIGSGTKNGAIKFKDEDELNRYFRNHCISEVALQQTAQTSSSLFMMLFWILLIIFIVNIVFQMCGSGRMNTGMNPVPVTTGRFSF